MTRTPYPHEAPATISYVDLLEEAETLRRTYFSAALEAVGISTTPTIPPAPAVPIMLSHSPTPVPPRRSTPVPHSLTPLPTSPTPMPSAIPGYADTYRLKDEDKELGRNFGDRVQELMRSMLNERVPNINIDDIRSEQNGIMSDIADILVCHDIAENKPEARKMVREFRTGLRELISRKFDEHERHNAPENYAAALASTVPPPPEPDAPVLPAFAPVGKTTPADFTQLSRALNKLEQKLFEGIDPDEQHSPLRQTLRELTGSFVSMVMNEYSSGFAPAELRKLEKDTLALIHETLEISGSSLTTADIRAKSFERAVREKIEDDLGPAPYVPEAQAKQEGKTR